MSKLEKFKDRVEEGLEQTWDNLREGWHHLQLRAGKALTFFVPPRRQNAKTGELITDDDEIFEHSSRWSVLAAEVKDYDDKVSVRLEVPGMDPNDLDIEVIGTTLHVSGEKHASREETKGSYYIMETAYGQFDRIISLPAEVDENNADAQYKRGILQIMLPKLMPAKRKKIKIKSK